MTSARVSRGRRTQEALALWYREHGWWDAEAVPASLKGRDIRKMPGLAPEVKARADFNPLAWTRQATANAGDDMPFVVIRCNGQGEANIGEWLVLRQLAYDTELLVAAGYQP